MKVHVVSGCRTPFVKAFGVFSDESFLGLSTHVVQKTIERSGIEPNEVDELVFSRVLLDPRIPNFAREIVLRSSLPDSLGAHSVSNNCISGVVAVAFAANGIEAGRIKTAIAGGAEFMSRPALSLRPDAESFFIKFGRARSLGERLQTLSGFRLPIPQPPSPKEPSTGLTMGEHCELTTKEFSIPRSEQDELALRSHLRAAEARTKGMLQLEIDPYAGIEEDNLIRPNTSLDKLASLRPVFDRSEKGTLTAGNSSPLTDGASAVCLMSDEEVQRRGASTLGTIEDIEFRAISPADGLLMAPGLALPALLHRNNLSIDDIDLFEVHEAFAAQVLANQVVWEKGWDKYPELQPVGRIPEDRINLHGGSIAIGHPFAATGGRLIMSALNQLRERGGGTAALSVCAAGAMAAAVLLRA